MAESEHPIDKQSRVLREIAAKFCENESRQYGLLTQIPPADKEADALTDQECALLLAVSLANQEDTQSHVCMSVNPTRHLINRVAYDSWDKSVRDFVKSSALAAKESDTESNNSETEIDWTVELGAIDQATLDGADAQPIGDTAGRIWRQWLEEAERLDTPQVRQKGRRYLGKLVDAPECVVQPARSMTAAEILEWADDVSKRLKGKAGPWLRYLARKRRALLTECLEAEEPGTGHRITRSNNLTSLASMLRKYSLALSEATDDQASIEVSEENNLVILNMPSRLP
ncbi:MAG: hypothetical protein AB8B91_14410 [Rubripirellula sp.]